MQLCYFALLTLVFELWAAPPPVVDFNDEIVPTMVGPVNVLTRRAFFSLAGLGLAIQDTKTAKSIIPSGNNVSSIWDYLLEFQSSTLIRLRTTTPIRSFQFKLEYAWVGGVFKPVSRATPFRALVQQGENWDLYFKGHPSDIAFRFNPDGRLGSIRDRTRITEFEYLEGRLKTIKLPDGDEVVFTYENGRLSKVDQKGYEYFFRYDKDGNLTHIGSSCGLLATFTYASAGLVNFVARYPDEQGIAIERYKDGSVKSFFDAVANGKSPAIKNGPKTYFTFLKSGGTRVNTTEGPVVYRFSSDEKLVSVESRQVTKTFSYVPNDSLLSSVITAIHPTTNQTTTRQEQRFDYDPSGNIKRVTVDGRNVWAGEHNLLDQLVTEKNGPSPVKTYDYLNDRVKTISIGPYVTDYSYDSRGFLTHKSIGGRQAPLFERVNDSIGRPTSITDSNGYITTFAYKGPSGYSSVPTETKSSNGMHQTVTIFTSNGNTQYNTETIYAKGGTPISETRTMDCRGELVSAENSTLGYSSQTSTVDLGNKGSQISSSFQFPNGQTFIEKETKPGSSVLVGQYLRDGKNTTPIGVCKEEIIDPKCSDAVDKTRDGSDKGCAEPEPKDKPKPNKPIGVPGPGTPTGTGETSKPTSKPGTPIPTTEPAMPGGGVQNEKGPGKKPPR